MTTIRAMFVPIPSALARGMDPAAWTMETPEGPNRREHIAGMLHDLIAGHVGASPSVSHVEVDPHGDGDDVLDFWKDAMDDEPIGSATWIELK